MTQQLDSEGFLSTGISVVVRKERALFAYAGGVLYVSLDRVLCVSSPQMPYIHDQLNPLSAPLKWCIFSPPPRQSLAALSLKRVRNGRMALSG